MAFFLIFSMVLGHLGLLTVVSDRNARAFNNSVATWAVALDVSKTFNRVWYAGLLENLMEFLVRYFALLCLFSVKDSFKWFWTGCLCRNIYLILLFLKAPLLVLYFSYYISMAFLMMSVILFSILIISLSTLSVIRHLLCGNNNSWVLNLNLT